MPNKLQAWGGGGGKRQTRRKGDVKMGNDEGHKKKEHGENKEGWGIIAFGVEE